MSNSSDALMLALAEECAILALQIEDLGHAIGKTVPMTPALVTEMQQFDRLSQAARVTSGLVAALCPRLRVRSGLAAETIEKLVGGIPLPEMRTRLSRCLRVMPSRKGGMLA